MRSDIDAMMQAHDIDVLLVTGPAQHNPAMVYLTGGGHLTRADLIKKRGEPGVLFFAPMEREEAAAAAEKSGLITRGYANYPLRALLEESGGDQVAASALRYRRMLADLGVTSGKVAIYGQADLRTAFPVFYELQRMLPEITLAGDIGDIILGTAMFTKDDAEVERIRRVGKITTAVVGNVADFLTSQRVQGEMLVDASGEPVTIGKVKGLINLWLAERGVENPEGTIFSIGHDAGVPHSTGKPGDILRLGQTIVFDIYPCEAGGGYFYDFTRTWCLGYAPEAVQKLYDDVRTVFTTLKSELRTGARYYEYHKRACDLYEAMGHPTIESNPETEEGYVHSLGHGVGLHIHERPFSSTVALEEDRLIPGVVATIEPGLYYPERGMGVRLEDTFWVRPDGKFEVLAEYPLDLVLPVKK